MFRLRVLGGIDLRDPAGHPVAGLLQQPRRLALLAWLAVRPDGFVRRDQLLPLFWPELDDARGRAALSQALHVIRRVMDPGVIRTRGTEEVAIAGDQLSVDVVDFIRATERQDWIAADRAYQGDLLPGFHLSEAAEFDHWLEETRTTLRGRAR